MEWEHQGDAGILWNFKISKNFGKSKETHVIN